MSVSISHLRCLLFILCGFRRLRRGAKALQADGGDVLQNMIKSDIKHMSGDVEEKLLGPLHLISRDDRNSSPVFPSSGRGWGGEWTRPRDTNGKYLDYATVYLTVNL